MSILEMIFIGGIVASILSLIGAIYGLINYLISKNRIKRLPTKKLKNKKKQERINKKRKFFIKKKKKHRTFFITSVIFMLLFGGASAYLSYYQAMNLTSADSDAVVKGYFLVRDFEEQLSLAKDERDAEDKLQQNIRYLATAMASYGTKKADHVNSREGQLIMNRYYNAVKQVGMNASTQTKNFYGNPQLVDEFLSDLSKVQEYEKALFEYYKVKESALSEES